MDIKTHYDLLIEENNDPFRDPPVLQKYMESWDGQVLSSTRPIIRRRLDNLPFILPSTRHYSFVRNSERVVLYSRRKHLLKYEDILVFLREQQQ